MKNNKFLIIIPIFNEEKNIDFVIDDLNKNCSDFDRVLIDDGSSDGTIKKIEKRNENYLELPFNLGYSGAIQTGFKYAEEKKYDYIVLFDGDGQHKAIEITKMIELAEKNNEIDIIIGSRYMKGSVYKKNFFRMIGTQLFSILIFILYQKKIYDPTSGFQLLSHRVFSKYSKMFNYPKFPDANLILEFFLNNYIIKEIPVEMRSRNTGKSMHSGLLKPIKYVIKMFYSMLIVIIRYFPKYIQRGLNKR